MRVATDAFYFLLPLLLLAVILGYLAWYWTAAIAVLLFLFVACFFRDPERLIPSEPDLIVSPADGKVVRIAANAGELPIQVSIFLSVFDVHINRAPVEGVVRKVEYRRGKFKAAFDDSASVDNEQSIVDMGSGPSSVRIALIAGLIARRIVSWIKVGDLLDRGQRIGLIRFGSRVDLFLPATARLEVKKGDRVLGGSSIIGRFVNTDDGSL